LGYVVFESETGRAIKYCKKIGTAKAHVTRHARANAEYLLDVPHARHQRTYLWCSYADYEGVLLGLDEPSRKLWVFCRG